MVQDSGVSFCISEFDYNQFIRICDIEDDGFIPDWLVSLTHVRLCLGAVLQDFYDVGARI